MSYLEKFYLHGKKAIIIGGAGLIGSEVSKALAECGASVLILDVNEGKGKKLSEELKSQSKEVDFELFDLCHINNLEKNFNNIIESRDLDIFVNCSYPRLKNDGPKSFEEIEYSIFRETVDIHMNSFCWLAKMAADKMANDSVEGSIIQFASIYGVVGQNLNIYESTSMREDMAYSVIKGGIINFSRQMASCYGKKKIRINTISPGGIADSQDENFVKQYNKNTPLGRMGNPQDIASAVMFLASENSSYLTGQNIIIDGGWTSI